MPSDPLLTAAKKWNRRLAAGANAGYSPGAMAAVRQADLTRVGAGGSAMSDQEALAAISAAATEHLPQSQRPSTSLAGIPGRLLADVGSSLEGLAVGAVHAIEHPVRDAKGLVQAAGTSLQELMPPSKDWQVAHGFEPSAGDWSPRGLAMGARNVAKSPLFKFLPGAQTLGNVTTAGGRQQMVAHPGFTAMDLVAVAAPALKGVARLGYLGDTAEAGSVAEAAAKGKVLTTAARAASDGLAKVTGGRVNVRGSLGDVLQAYGLTRRASQAVGQLHDWAKNLSPEDRAQAWDLHIAGHPGFAALAEEEVPSREPFGAADEGPTRAEHLAKHRSELAAWHGTAEDLKTKARAAAAAYDSHVSHVEELGKGTLVDPVDHPPERTASPATWHEVSAVIRSGQFKLKLAAPEGWYLHGADGQEYLVPRKGYVAPEVRIPPDPAAMKRATDRAAVLQGESAAAHQALADHLAGGPPRLAEYVRPPVAHEPTPALSPAQETLKRVFESGGPEGPDPALLRALPPEQQAIVRQAFINQGKLLALASWHDMGIVRTAADIEEHASKLDPALRDRYFNSWVHFDPLEQMGLGYLRDNPAVLGAVPGLADSAVELANAYSMPVDVYRALFKNDGYVRGVLTSVGGDTGTELESRNPGKIGKVSQRGMRLFKGAVFLRPTMIPNIAIRGLIMAVGDQGLAVLKPETISKAFDMARAGDPTVMSGWRKMSTDQAHSFLAGTTAGRIVGSIPGALRRVTEFTSSVQRALVFVAEHDRMIDAGAEESAARMAGMSAIREVFNLHDSMTPVEQAVIRQVMPFYGYTKLVVNYLARFPSEHPFATDVLGKIGESEVALNSSGIPAQLRAMLWLGAPDASGNVKAIDVSGFNPFRSFVDPTHNPLSLAGFVGQLNPALKIVLDGLGVHDLYPAAQYDPVTGGLVAKAPGISLGSIAGAMVPQLNTLEAMVGWNNRLKALKQSDPSAYRAALFRGVGIPIPESVNVPQATAKAEESLYRVSSAAVGKYLKTGDAGYIAGFNLLPYANKWWTPEQLQEFYDRQRATLNARPAPANVPAPTSLRALLAPRRTPAQLPPGA